MHQISISYIFISQPHNLINLMYIVNNNISHTFSMYTMLHFLKYNGKLPPRWFAYLVTSIFLIVSVELCTQIMILIYHVYFTKSYRSKVTYDWIFCIMSFFWHLCGQGKLWLIVRLRTEFDWQRVIFFVSKYILES